MANISFYGSHNAAFVVEDKGEIVVVLEMERFLNYKNSGLAQYRTPKAHDIVFFTKYTIEYLAKKFGYTEYENCYFINSDVIIGPVHYHLEDYIPAKNKIQGLHHKAHAAGCFYQSPYREALIFSFDGGGNDGKFNIYTCKRGEEPVLLENVINPVLNKPHTYYDLGFPYMVFGHYLKDIKFQDLGSGNLVYPGKLMGLASYGKVRQEWLQPFINFYKSDPDGNTYQERIDNLGKIIGVTFDVNNRLSGELAYDIATTSQKAFEECFLEVAKPYIDKYPDLPICITGGCGLNIILNTRVYNEFGRKVFIGPNPNDCGVALGLMLNALKPMVPIDATYPGLPLLDLETLPDYIQNTGVHFTSHYFDQHRLVDDLIRGKIIGVARSRAEHGPRALGNRSILCNPSIPEMKDILNAKVKHREWYRPFAPVVRLEDVSTYFEWLEEARWMSFCPTVKPEWREKLAAITHVDNTARVQTVTKEQNEWLYNVLTEFKEKTGVGVLLNTSFNVDGKPILSTVRDAFEILGKTQLDGLVIEHYYFIKDEPVF